MANTLNLGDGNWATKEDSLLAYNSENNNYKPLPFDFSRGSSATRVNKDGLIETVGSGQARIDYTDDSKGALLLEPSRTNLILTSASGTYGNQPASETNTISPDGTNNAVIPTPDGNSDRYEYSISSDAYATDTKLTYSWYRKRISTPINTSYIGDLQMNVLVNVTQVGSTTQIQSDVNGFDRFQAIFNITDGSASSIIRAYFGSIIGAGNSSIAYWGHQLEEGSYATSYIPTQGGVETRLADSCNNDFSVISTVANTNTVVLKFIPMGFDVDFAELLRFSDGTNEIALEGFSTNNYDMYGSGLTSSGMVDGALSLDAGSINTISFSYSGTSLRFSHNGSTINTIAPTGNLPTITEVSHSVGVLSPIKILDLRVYNDFKTQEELNTLTI